MHQINYPNVWSIPIFDIIHLSDKKTTKKNKLLQKILNECIRLWIAWFRCLISLGEWQQPMNTHANLFFIFVF